MRPPRPYPTTEVSAGLPVVDGTLDVFAPSFQNLVDLQNQLSAAELGQLPPGGAGDFSTTLFGLSALIAHVLGVYQDFYGGEAFLATARTEQSLVRHGRRVGYTTDPGVAATGVVAVNVKTGLSGTLPAGLPLLSVPKGEQGTESYETLDARAVDAKWNEIEVLEKTVTLERIADNATSIDVLDTGFDLAAGETVLFVRLDSMGNQNPDAEPLLRTLVGVEEHPATGTTAGWTTLTVDSPISDDAPIGEWRILAKPDLDLRLFGWDADPRVFPPSNLRDSGKFTHRDKITTGGVPTSQGDVVVTVFPAVFGYEAFDETSDALDSDLNDLYLARALDTSIEGTWVLRAQGEGGAALTPYFVTAQKTVSVSFVREEQQDTSVNLTSQTNADASPPGDTSTFESASTTFVKTWISASTTAIQVDAVENVPDTSSKASPRALHDVRSRWLGGWQLALELKAEEPNPGAIVEGDLLKLEGDLTGLEPGMLAVLSSPKAGAAQLVELTSVIVSADTTSVVWKRRGAAADHVFTKDDTVVFGNVVRVSHGKLVSEVLGDSDGVTPFLRFSLKKSPVTQLPDALGAVPALEVRVADVLWERVVDFADSGPEDRHYVVQRDENQVTQILFGDGQKGAIPSAGRRHIHASYRQGLGRNGNVEAGRLSRLDKAHPLVTNLRNPLAVAGGTEPASLDQIRIESTKYIRTFNRAVSAPDYADLALLFPGVARSQATSSPSSGVELVVSDADGLPLVDAATFLTFLDARRDRSVPLKLKDPKPVELVVSVRVEYDPAFFDFQVERAVREALASTSELAPGLFTFRGRRLGEPGFLSQAYQAVNGAAGVVFSEIVIFDLLPVPAADSTEPPSPPALRDAVRIAPHEWLHLDPKNLQIETRKGL